MNSAHVCGRLTYSTAARLRAARKAFEKRFAPGVLPGVQWDEAARSVTVDTPTAAPVAFHSKDYRPWLKAWTDLAAPAQDGALKVRFVRESLEPELVPMQIYAGGALGRAMERVAPVEAVPAAWFKIYGLFGQEFLCAAFTPSGAQLVVGIGESHFTPAIERDTAALLVVDARTGQEVRRLDGFTAVPQALALAPDGRRAVTYELSYVRGKSYAYQGHLRVWNLSTWTREASVRADLMTRSPGFTGGDHCAYGVWWLPNNRILAAEGACVAMYTDALEPVTEVSADAGLRDPKHSAPERYQSVALSADGAVFAVASALRGVGLWKLTASTIAPYTALARPGYYSLVALSADGSLLAAVEVPEPASSMQERTELVRAPTGSVLRLYATETMTERWSTPLATSLDALAFAPDGSHLVGVECTPQHLALRRWELVDGRERAAPPPVPFADSSPQAAERRGLASLALHPRAAAAVLAGGLQYFR